MPNALIESKRASTPLKVPLELKARKLTSYMATSEVAGTPAKGVPYATGSGSGVLGLEVGGVGVSWGVLAQLMAQNRQMVKIGNNFML